MAPKKAPNVLGEKHFPVSASEVEAWLSRMDDVGNAIHDFLHATPEQDAARVKAREEQRRQELIAADKERRKRRYDTRYYTRYDSDSVVDALLAEADRDSDEVAKERKDREEAAQRRKESDGYSRFEILSLEEAKKKKIDGNAAVKAGNWTEAKAAYDYAINLDPVDRQLLLDLHNNRALVHVKLELWAEAVEDATFVLQRERHNVKALLRRARGLVELHRPSDALQDVVHVLRAEKGNVEAMALQREASKAEDEIAFADRVRADRPDAVDALIQSTHELAAALALLTEALAVRVQEAAPEGGSAEPTRVMKTDTEVDEAVDAFALALCKAGTHLVDSGTATVFRLANGVTCLLRAFYLAEQAFGLSDATSAAAPHARVAQTPGGTVLVASLLRVMARAFDTPTSIAIVCDDAKRVERLLHVASKLSVVSFSAETAAPSLLSATAAMQLLAALAADLRAAPLVWAALSNEDGINVKEWIANWKEDPRCPEALRAVDHVLRVASLQRQIVAFGWDALALQAVVQCLFKKGGADVSFSVRDTGASLLCRLSAVPSWRDAFDGKDDVTKSVFLGTVCRAIRHMLDQGSSNGDALNRDALATEALLAVLHNVSLVAGNRPAVAAAMDKEDVPARLVDFVVQHWDAARRGDYVNIVARALGVLGKVMLFSQTAVTASQQRIEDLTKWLSFDLATQTAATQSEKEYRDTCVENAALIIASLLTKARDGPTPDASVAIRLCSLPLDEGFGRLVNVIRVAPARAAGNAAMALSCLPALYAPTIALAVQVDGFAKTFLDRIVSLRTELFELEKLGQRGNSEWSGAKGAKRNIAIALSKYCGNEIIMQAVRDLRGIEILYAAMDASDKVQGAA